MKRKFFIALAVVLTAGISGNLIAQEPMQVTKTRTKSNQTNEKLTTQSSVCVGKIQCADGSCAITFEQEIVSPRDAASGLPTGKRQHKPFTIIKELDQSSQTALRESPTKVSSGKVSYSDLSVMVKSKGKSSKLAVMNNQFTMPKDCDDDCDVVVSWSWGESNTGASKRYEATFNLALQEGVFMESKHTKPGHVTLLK